MAAFAGAGRSLKNKKKSASLLTFCDPAGTRTQDPYIKSVLLYQLSYGIIRATACAALNGVQK